jgi:hypothetical protein
VPTSFSFLSFAVSLAEAGRIITTRQLARHPEVSWRTQPIKRAGEFLAAHRDIFESMPGPVGEPYRWRLTKEERRKRGIHQKAINGWSQRAEHWLGIGDIWLELTFNGGRPTKWRTEPDGQFDLYCVWQDIPYLIEYQRTPITTKQWGLKWDKRIEWYRKQKWDVKPKVVLVNTTGQQDDTICLPRGTIHVRNINHLHHALRPPRL